MDRETYATNTRMAYAELTLLREDYVKAGLSDSVDAVDRIVMYLERAARLVLGPSFRFEPDLDRKTDVTPARMSGLRPAAVQPDRPALSVIPGGARSDERPSAGYIDDSADDAPKAG